MSPRTPAANALRREDARLRLVDAALETFARRGYAAATVKEIAAAAGCAQGLLYHYFPGKDALLRAVFDRGMADVEASFAAAGTGAPAERLARLVRAAFATVRDALPFWRLLYALRHQPEVDGTLGPAFAQWTAAILGTLEAHLRALGHPDPATGARVLFAAIDGGAQHYALDPDGYPVAAVVDAIVATAVAHLPGAAMARGHGARPAGSGDGA